ncbi:Gti1/Pac2 family-domain-containing protein [Mycena galericulata]|nr:Gti1/Pac2 family-domain-containing protein [Mycena galericulata]
MRCGSPVVVNTSATSTTHCALHIRNVEDALVVLEAVRGGLLPLRRLRLSTCEREELRSGNVFVWEESQEEGGLVRWTDGRRWSQSKVTAEGLIYEEKEEVTEEERAAKALRRARRICNPGSIIHPPPRNQRPSKSGGLTKQTYSFLVRLPGSCETRKWHTVAYTSWAERGNLPVIEDYPALRGILVPVGVFARSKATDPVNMYFTAHTGAGDMNDTCGETVARRAADTPRHPHIVRPSPAHNCDSARELELPLFRPGRHSGTEIFLPPFSSLRSPWGRASVLTDSEVVSYTYMRDRGFQEDRRILDSFKLKL